MIINNRQYTIVGAGIFIVLLLGTIVLLWRTNLSKANELSTLKSQINITEDIAKTKARLDEMKKREAEDYVLLEKQRAKLRSTLLELDRQQKILAKITKEGVKKNVEKLNLLDLHRELVNRDIGNTIISQ
jgi:hypothetical protein